MHIDIPIKKEKGIVQVSLTMFDLVEATIEYRRHGPKNSRKILRSRLRIFRELAGIMRKIPGSRVRVEHQEHANVERIHAKTQVCVLLARTYT